MDGSIANDRCTMGELERRGWANTKEYAVYSHDIVGKVAGLGMDRAKECEVESG